MSFSKAVELLALAQLAGARHQGVSYEDIRERFGCSLRTAQRMVEALSQVFDTESLLDAEGRRRIRLQSRRALDLPLRPEVTLEALQLAERTARAEDRPQHAEALAMLRDEALAGMGAAKARRAETDAEALLQAWGQVVQPGPRMRIDPQIIAEVIEALRGPFQIEVLYRNDHAPRILEPHGVLRGPRSYLVARQPSKGRGLMKYRLDLITSVRRLDSSFTLEPSFSIEDYAALGFGVWHDEAEFAEVHWRFAPEVADRAEEFVFHPRQSVQREGDGALSVRFKASGWTEMAWYLYQWGDKVEVLAPDALRQMVEGHRRSDIAVVP